jgi:putative PIN family toxin of toxin-antitoxin system
LIVIDASVVISAALKPASIPRTALARARSIDRLAMSAAVAAELRSVLRRPKFAHILTDVRVTEAEDWILTGADWFDPKIIVTGCRDPKDNKYLELALAANANIIVSYNKDLLALAPWRGIRILSPAEYLATV